MRSRRNITTTTVYAFTAIVSALAFGQVAAAAEESTWTSLKRDIFDNRQIVEDAAGVQLEAPYRAEDAAIVPISVRISPDLAAKTKKLTLVVDENPAPVVAEFHYGPAAGIGERYLATRIRVNSYSNVRAVIETNDGKLVMAAKFVKAAGGCAAPALKDADAALAAVGKMRIKKHQTANSAKQQQAQLMIRHPQYSGFQMNQLTHLYIPAEFITDLEVKRGGDVVFRMTGGISISENPNIRFSYAAGADDTLKVTAKDTESRVFTTTTISSGS